MFSRIGVLLLAMRDYAYRMVYSIPVNRQHTAPGTSYVQRNCELGWTSDDRRSVQNIVHSIIQACVRGPSPIVVPSDHIVLATVSAWSLPSYYVICARCASITLTKVVPVPFQA